MKDKDLKKLTKVISDIAYVRTTGLVNMFFRKDVVQVLKEFDLMDSANYISSHKDEYLEMLTLSAKYYR